MEGGAGVPVDPQYSSFLLYRAIYRFRRRGEGHFGVDVDRNSTFGNPTDGNNSTVRGIIMKIIYFCMDNFEEYRNICGQCKKLRNILA